MKTLSIILAAAFLAQDLVWASPEIARAVSFSRPLLPVPIPASVALVEDSQRAGKRVFYLIQDAHTNESAQLNIAKTLEILKTNYVFLEAGVGDDSLSFLRQYGASETRERVARSYLKKGWIQGPDYFDLTSDRDIQLWGVEDKELYRKSVEGYRSLAEKREHVNAYLDKFSRAVKTLKPRIYNPSLAVFDARVQSFGAGGVSLTEYAETLVLEARGLSLPLDSFPNVLKLGDIRDKESRINFEKANQEQVKAVASFSAEDQEVIREVSEKDRSPFRLDCQDHCETKGFYAFLENILAKNARGAAAKDYPELLKYLAYLKEARKLDPERLLREQKGLERLVYAALARTKDEKRLHESDEAVSLLRKLLNLTIATGEFEAIERDPRKFDVVELSGYLNKKIMDLEQYYEDALFLDVRYEEAFAEAKTFYRLTKERDRAFLRNALAKMEAEHQDKAVLVAGGYHADHLVALFRQHGISYVSIRPQVLSETNQKKYESILLGQTLRGAPATPRHLGVAPGRELELIAGSARLKVTDALGRELRGARLAVEEGVEDRGDPENRGSDHLLMFKAMMRLAHQQGVFLEEEIRLKKVLNIGLETVLGAMSPWNLVSALASHGVDIVGLDPGDQIHQFMGERYVRGEAQNIPFRNSVFDLAVSLGLFHDEFFSLPEMRKGVRETQMGFFVQAGSEIKRVLKDGGKFLVSLGSLYPVNPIFLTAFRALDFEIIPVRGGGQGLTGHYLLINHKAGARLAAGLPEANAAGTAAEELLRVFKLEEAEWLWSKAYPGLTAHRIHVPETRSGRRSLKGPRILSFELAPVEYFDVLYDAESRLVGIFPVPEGGQNAFYYYDFSDYYVPISLLKSMGRDFEEGLDLEAQWAPYIDRIRESKRLLEEFKREAGYLAEGYRARPRASIAEKPFIYAEVDLKTGRIRTLQFDPARPPARFEKDPYPGLPAIFYAVNGKEKAVFPNYPSVYPAGRFMGEDGYTLRRVTQLIRSKEIRDGDNVLDSATGTGFLVWLQWAMAKHRGLELNYYAHDISPLAVANAKVFLQDITGIPVTLKIGGRVVSRTGTPLFGKDVLFKVVTSNGPDYRYSEGKLVSELRPPESLDDYWDSGLAGKRYSDHLASYLHRVLADDGVALVWAPVFGIAAERRLRESGLQFELESEETNVNGVYVINKKAGARLAETPATGDLMRDLFEAYLQNGEKDRAAGIARQLHKHHSKRDPLGADLELGGMYDRLDDSAKADSSFMNVIRGTEASSAYFLEAVTGLVAAKLRKRGVHAWQDAVSRFKRYLAESVRTRDTGITERIEIVPEDPLIGGIAGILRDLTAVETTDYETLFGTNFLEYVKDAQSLQKVLKESGMNASAKRIMERIAVRRVAEVELARWKTEKGTAGPVGDLLKAVRARANGVLAPAIQEVLFDTEDSHFVRALSLLKTSQKLDMAIRALQGQEVAQVTLTFNFTHTEVYETLDMFFEARRSPADRADILERAINIRDLRDILERPEGRGSGARLAAGKPDRERILRIVRDAIDGYYGTIEFIPKEMLKDMTPGSGKSPKAFVIDPDIDFIPNADDPRSDFLFPVTLFAHLQELEREIQAAQPNWVHICLWLRALLLGGAEPFEKAVKEEEGDVLVLHFQGWDGYRKNVLAANHKIRQAVGETWKALPSDDRALFLSQENPSTEQVLHRALWQAHNVLSLYAEKAWEGRPEKLEGLRNHLLGAANVEAVLDPRDAADRFVEMVVDKFIEPLENSLRTVQNFPETPEFFQERHDVLVLVRKKWLKPLLKEFEGPDQREGPFEKLSGAYTSHLKYQVTQLDGQFEEAITRLKSDSDKGISGARLAKDRDELSFRKGTLPTDESGELIDESLNGLFIDLYELVRAAQKAVGRHRQWNEVIDFCEAVVAGGPELAEYGAGPAKLHVGTIDALGRLIWLAGSHHTLEPKAQDAAFKKIRRDLMADARLYYWVKAQVGDLLPAEETRLIAKYVLFEQGSGRRYYPFNAKQKKKARGLIGALPSMNPVQRAHDHRVPLWKEPRAHEVRNARNEVESINRLILLAQTEDILQGKRGVEAARRTWDHLARRFFDGPIPAEIKALVTPSLIARALAHHDVETALTTWKFLTDHWARMPAKFKRALSKERVEAALKGEEEQIVWSAWKFLVRNWDRGIPKTYQESGTRHFTLALTGQAAGMDMRFLAWLFLEEHWLDAPDAFKETLAKHPKRLSEALLGPDEHIARKAFHFFTKYWVILPDDLQHEGFTAALLSQNENMLTWAWSLIMSPATILPMEFVYSVGASTLREMVRRKNLGALRSLAQKGALGKVHPALAGLSPLEAMTKLILDTMRPDWRGRKGNLLEDAELSGLNYLLRPLSLKLSRKDPPEKVKYFAGFLQANREDLSFNEQETRLLDSLNEALETTREAKVIPHPKARKRSDRGTGAGARLATDSEERQRLFETFRGLDPKSEKRAELYNVLIEKNIGLVRKVARERAKGNDDKEEEYVQLGMLGLARAIAKYDPARGKFSTYAMWWIRQAIDQGRNRTDALVYIPEGEQGIMRVVKRGIEDWKQKNGREPDRDEIDGMLAEAREKLYKKRIHVWMERNQRQPDAAKEAELEAGVDAAIQRALELIRSTHIIRLEDPTREEGSQVTDRLPQTRYTDPAKDLAEGDEQELEIRYARALLETLSPRQKLVIKLRHGIGTRRRPVTSAEEDAPYTLDEIGGVLGITRERVRQIENEAAEAMRTANVAWKSGPQKPADHTDVRYFEKLFLAPGDAEARKELGLILGEEIKQREEKGDDLRAKGAAAPAERISTAQRVYDVLQKLRQEGRKGITQDEIAALAGTHASYLSILKSMDPDLASAIDQVTGSKETDKKILQAVYALKARRRGASITLKDVAQEAGVAVATIRARRSMDPRLDRVLKGMTPFSQTDLKIVAAIQSLKARKAAGAQQKDIAEEAGIPPQDVTNRKASNPYIARAVDAFIAASRQVGAQSSWPEKNLGARLAEEPRTIFDRVKVLEAARKAAQGRPEWERLVDHARKMTDGRRAVSRLTNHGVEISVERLWAYSVLIWIAEGNHELSPARRDEELREVVDGLRNDILLFQWARFHLAGIFPAKDSRSVPLAALVKHSPRKHWYRQPDYPETNLAERFAKRLSDSHPARAAYYFGSSKWEKDRIEEPLDRTPDYERFMVLLLAAKRTSELKSQSAPVLRAAWEELAGEWREFSNEDKKLLAEAADRSARRMVKERNYGVLKSIAVSGAAGFVYPKWREFLPAQIQVMLLVESRVQEAKNPPDKTLRDALKWFFERASLEGWETKVADKETAVEALKVLLRNGSEMELSGRERAQIQALVRAAKKPAVPGEAERPQQGARFAAASRLENFFVGVAHAYSASALNGARLALAEREERATIYELTYHNRAFKAVPDDGRAIVLDDADLRRNRFPAKKLEEALTLPDLRQMEEARTELVSRPLGELALSHEKPVIVEINLDLIDNPSFEFYLDHWIDALKEVRRGPFGQNTFFKIRSAKPFLAALAKQKAPSFFIEDGEEKRLGIEEAARVRLSPASLGLSKESINIPVRNIEEGEIPAFKALLRLAIASGRIDLERIPDAFLTAYRALAGEALSSAALSGILKGLADPETVLRYAVKPIIRVPIDKAVQFFRLIKRMVEQAA